MLDAGQGRVLSYLEFRGVNWRRGLDRSANSISLIVSRYKLPGAVADNLQAFRFAISQRTW